MLTIRFARFGRTNRPSYRIVVQEKRRAPSSVVIETLGNYDPLEKPARFEVNAERVKHWVNHGAQVSDSLYNMLIDRGVLQGTKRKVSSAKKKAAEEEAPSPAPQATPAAVPPAAE